MAVTTEWDWSTNFVITNDTTKPKFQDLDKYKIQEDDNANVVNFHLKHCLFKSYIEKMKPVDVEGLEHICGILGLIENSSVNVDGLKMGKPKDGALLWARMALYIPQNPKHFDCSKCRNIPQVLKLDEASSLPGILKACRSLCPGQFGYFFLPANTMYGMLGCPPLVPKNTPIFMIVESIKWTDLGAPDRYLKLEEIDKKNFTIVFDLVKGTNDAAAAEFSERHYKPALELFHEIISMLKNCDINYENRDIINSYMMKTYINIALCYIILQNAMMGISALDEASVLGDYKRNCKYLFNRGKCHYMLEQYEDAMKFYLMALDVEPNNINIGNELLKIDAVIFKQQQSELALFKNMLSENKNISNEEQRHCEDLANVVSMFCDELKRSGANRYPLPPLLLHEEIEIIKNIASTKGFDVDSKVSEDGGIEYDFLIKSS